MKYLRRSFYFGFLLLMFFATSCTLGTATPTSAVSCVQTGCAYPAVCDKNSGQCTIYQTPAAGKPALANPPGVGAIAANNPNTNLLPACPAPWEGTLAQSTLFAQIQLRV